MAPIVGLLLGLAVAQCALADQAAVPAASSACLVKPVKPLEYPEREKVLRTEGVLRYKLSFTSPDRAPEVELQAFSGSSELAEAAKIYLKAYRLPCLVQGERAEFLQEMAFQAIPTGPAETAESSDIFSCLRTPGPQSVGQSQQPSYMPKRPQTGNVLMQMSFTAADQSPQLKTIYASGGKAFIESVMETAAQYRLPCMKSGDEPRVMEQLFRFMGYDRGTDFALRDMDLGAFLGFVKDLDKTLKRFDLRTMSCPFQVKWTLYQPASRNPVREIGPKVPEREPFLDWLASLSLKINSKQFDDLLGASMVLSVPCAVIEP